MADNFEFSTKGDTRDISEESQQSGSRKFEQENSEITEKNVLPKINKSNENRTYCLSQVSNSIILLQGHFLDTVPSGCHVDVLPTISTDNEDVIDNCMSTSGVFNPLRESKNILCETRIAEFNIPEQVETSNSNFDDENEVEQATSFPTTLNKNWNRDSPSDNESLKDMLGEGSEKDNLQHTDIPMTMDNAEDFGFSNVQRNDVQQLSLQNSKESQNEILTEVAYNRNELKTSDSVYNLEGVAGPSRPNDQRQSYYLKDGQFFCRVCGKVFSRKKYLDAHCITHTGKKLAKCDICGKSISQKRNLKKHGRTHTKEKPYICPVCGQAFTDRSNYNRHTKNKHLKK